MTAAVHLMSPAEYGRKEGSRWHVATDPGEVGCLAWLSATKVHPPYSYDELDEIQRVAQERHAERIRAATARAAAAPAPPVLPPIAALLADEMQLPATPTEVAHDREGADQ